MGDAGHKDGLTNPCPWPDNTEPVFQTPVRLPSLERGRHDKKGVLYPHVGGTVTHWAHTGPPCIGPYYPKTHGHFYAGNLRMG